VSKVFVHTFGCQMNQSDSDRMVELLERHQWERTSSADEADLILLNTCAIRDRAERKLRSVLGRYRAVKARRGALIVVAGCVAQQEKERLLRQVPAIDFVFGPDQLSRLPELLARAGAGAGRFAETGWMEAEEYLFPRAEPGAARGRATAFVTAMKGCDNVCAFCVVPQTRGREVSRPFAEVVAEAEALVAVGVREVTLLGQNVNSYRGGCSFAALLRRVAAVPGLARVRFVTSHPHDLSDELVAVFRDEPRVMGHFHLPVQSGSDAVLARMRRDYTAEAYLARHDALAAARPGIAITTDFIVGFPGETDEDFEGSLALLRRARFDNAYAFAFSPRPQTVAARRLGSAPDWQEVPRAVTAARLERLQRLQGEITAERLRAELGREVEVLVEGIGDDGARRFGRTPENRLVHFDASEAEAPAGALLRVRVVHAGQASLGGELLDRAGAAA
jgi:tRNA-2-methylthio-N6-dimethylallyladenosine synthase